MSRWQLRFVECLAFGGVVLLLASLVLPVDTEGVQDARQAGCRHNLAQIGLALQAYHGRYGSFPPAHVADSQGRRLHSWRSLILPYLGHKTLYNSIWFSKPWDEEKNLDVLKRLQDESLPHSCPVTSSDTRSTVGRVNETSYLAIVGPHAAWPGEKPARLLHDFPDGPKQTILVIEVEDSGILWTEPRDLEFDDMNFIPNGDTKKSMSSGHTKVGRWPWSRRVPVVNVLFADGSVKSLPVDTSAGTIRALVTRDGGERVSPD